MDSIRSEKQKLQKNIFELISAMHKTEDFIENAIKKAGNASSGDTQALRANLAILRDRTNEKIKIYKKRLAELRQKVA